MVYLFQNILKILIRTWIDRINCYSVPVATNNSKKEISKNDNCKNNYQSGEKVDW